MRGIRTDGDFHAEGFDREGEGLCRPQEQEALGFEGRFIDLVPFQRVDFHAKFSCFKGDLRSCGGNIFPDFRSQSGKMFCQTPELDRAIVVIGFGQHIAKLDVAHDGRGMPRHDLKGRSKRVREHVVGNGVGAMW